MTDAELEEIGEAEIRHRVERGDYHAPAELSTVTKWLQRKDKEHDFLAACKRASVSSALDASRAARRANFIAIVAVVIAAIGAHEPIASLFSAIFNAVKP